MAISSGLGSSALLPAGLGFRNKIINGDFRINQRSFTSTTTSGTYGFDRWCLEYSTGTSTYTPQTFTTGSPAATGFESANFARVVSSGQTATSAYTMLFQRIEDVRILANSTATISFWAKASSGTPSVAIELQQNFGSGGSPSSQVNNYAGKVTLSTSWVRYSVTYLVPNIDSKTIGSTANSSFTGLNLWTSSGSDYNSRTGSIGIQSATIDFWGVQVEQNYQPTPFEQRPIGVELALCQRYFYRLANTSASSCFFSNMAHVAYTATAIEGTIQHPVPMRSHVVTFATNSVYAYNALLGSAVVVPRAAITAANSTIMADVVSDRSTGSFTTQVSYALAANTAAGYFDVSVEL